MNEMSTLELQIAERLDRRVKVCIPLFTFSETNLGGTGCGKAARPGLWGSGEATNRSTRKKIYTHRSMIINFMEVPWVTIENHK